MTARDAHEAVQYDIGGGKTYGLAPGLSREELHGLATSILTKLGVSYELLIPGHEGAWGGRAEVLRRMREDAEEYAASRDPSGDREREEIAAAYRRGWESSPKPISYPVRREVHAVSTERKLLRAGAVYKQHYRRARLEETTLYDRKFDGVMVPADDGLWVKVTLLGDPDHRSVARRRDEPMYVTLLSLREIDTDEGGNE